tara:strand:+ start:1583 stop:2449 length:867 start_codon:yes stop_codon:yes gene_type:complete
MTKKIYDQLKPLVNQNDLFDIQDNGIVIFGGNGKMGQQFAITLAASGANVIIADLAFDDSFFSLCSSDIQKKIHFFECDVSNETEISMVIEKTTSEFGGIDSLIYNVMAKPKGYYKKLDSYSLECWNKVMDANLSGAFLAVKELLNQISSLENKEKGTSIILTSSTYGVSGPDQRIYDGCNMESNIYTQDDPLCTPLSYSASKSALIGMVKYLASSLGKHNVRVNALVPGGIFDGQDESFHQAYVDRVPLERMATMSDYNGAILFLCSQASRYMTGANLVIDGGWTCR